MKKNLKFLSVILFTIILSSCFNQNEDFEWFLLEIPETYNEAIETPDITVKWVKVELEGDRLQIWDLLTDVLLDKKADFFDEVDTTKIWDYTWYRIIQSVPSLDTPVCTLQTKQLEAAAKLFPDVTFFIVSTDTPFALQRFCSANSINNLVVLSDARTREFWKENGLFLPEFWILSRAVFIINNKNEIVYVDYAEEVTDQLDLLNALAFLKSLTEKKD